MMWRDAKRQFPEPPRLLYLVNQPYNPTTQEPYKPYERYMTYKPNTLHDSYKPDKPS